MKYYKYHGLGNDFLFIDEKEIQQNLSEIAKKICDRHTGIGADGLIVAKDHSTHFEMVYYNSDGSRAKMCGNGIRCFVKYLVDKLDIKDKELSIETLAGTKKIKILNTNPFFVQVNMGMYSMSTKDFDIETELPTYLKQTIIIENETFEISSLLMNVEHTILFVDELNESEMIRIGSLIEQHPLFPNRTNVNFVKVIDSKTIQMQTFERGAGLTLACGTGACAAVALTHYLGITDSIVEVQLKLGTLEIEIKDTHEVFMTGPATYIGNGEVYV